MKKKIRRVFVLFLVVMQLFLLCGCDALDQMRHEQGYFGQGTDILWNGATYKLLPTSEYLYPEMDYEATVWITTEDVPVLLSQLLSEQWLSPSVDGMILESESGLSYYCREDIYEQLTQRIREGFETEVVCYNYDVYDEEEWEFVRKTYILTEQQVEVIEKITDTVEPDVMGGGWTLDYQWAVPLQECSGDMLLRRSELEIAYTGSTYYLLRDTETQLLVYEVPQTDYPMFDEITKDYEEAWNTEWEDIQWDDEEIFI